MPWRSGFKRIAFFGGESRPFCITVMNPPLVRSVHFSEGLIVGACLFVVLITNLPIEISTIPLHRTVPHSVKMKLDAMVAC